MNTAAVIRKVQRAFGDSNEIVITKTDIVDWINEAQIEIVRETGYRSTSSATAASTFIGGKTIADMLLCKSVTYDDRRLTLVGDDYVFNLQMQEEAYDEPQYYYMQGISIHLWPEPEASDSTSVTVLYVDAPTDLADDTGTLDLPVTYHEDIVRFCIMRAHERNENFRASEKAEQQFKEHIGQRRFESHSQDDSYPQIQSDYEDIT